MTPEREEQLLNLKDELLQAIARVDELLCGPEAAEDDEEVWDNTATVMVTHENLKQSSLQETIRPITKLLQ